MLLPAEPVDARLRWRKDAVAGSIRVQHRLSLPSDLEDACFGRHTLRACDAGQVFRREIQNTLIWAKCFNQLPAENCSLSHSDGASLSAPLAKSREYLIFPAKS